MLDLSRHVLLRVTGISVVRPAGTLRRHSWNFLLEWLVGNSSLTVTAERVEVTTDRLLLFCFFIK